MPKWSSDGREKDRPPRGPRWSTRIGAVELILIVLAVIIMRSQKIVQLQIEKEITKAQFEHAAKLASVGELSAGVAHEVNNPLTWLMGNVECLQVLLDDHAEALPEHLIEELGEIAIEMRDGAERIRRIVAGLKPFTRSDEDAFGPVDLLDVLDAAVEQAANEIRHRARLVRRIRKVPPVYGNHARLTQAFVNLLNAAQAIARGHATDTPALARQARWKGYLRRGGCSSSSQRFPDEWRRGS